MYFKRKRLNKCCIQVKIFSDFRVQIEVSFLKCEALWKYTGESKCVSTATAD